MNISELIEAKKDLESQLENINELLYVIKDKVFGNEQIGKLFYDKDYVEFQFGERSKVHIYYYLLLKKRLLLPNDLLLQKGVTSFRVKGNPVRISDNFYAYSIHHSISLKYIQENGIGDNDNLKIKSIANKIISEVVIGELIPLCDRPEVSVQPNNKPLKDYFK